MTPAKLENVRVRIAPSPTGHWHIGGVRTALFNWLFARKHGGSFVLRVEDTDAERSKQEYEIEVATVMRWLGLDWDEGPAWELRDGSWQSSSRGAYGPYRQSDRLAAYRKYLEQLLAENKAYQCYCSKEDLEAERQYLLGQGLPPKYGGHCRQRTSPPAGKVPQSIRFRTPEVAVKFKDMIRGTVSFDMMLAGDFIIARNLDSPLYNFAAVVDDALMEISHVIRGEEHLSNTPRQILLAQALGLRSPEFGHLPLILAKDRSKLSKRHMETSFLGYQEEGYLPEAMINFMVLLGWHPSGNNELLTRDELIAAFDIGRIQKAGAIFDIEKLQWMNAHYLRTLDPADLATRTMPFFEKRGVHPAPAFLMGIIAAERDRAKTLADFVTLGDFFVTLPDYESSLLIWRGSDRDGAKTSLQASRAVLEAISEEDFSRARIVEALQPLIDAADRGSVLWPLRAALSGLQASPDPYVIASVLGKSETMRRLDMALAKL